MQERPSLFVKGQMLTNIFAPCEIQSITYIRAISQSTRKKCAAIRYVGCKQGRLGCCLKLLPTGCCPDVLFNTITDSAGLKVDGKFRLMLGASGTARPRNSRRHLHAYCGTPRVLRCLLLPQDISIKSLSDINIFHRYSVQPPQHSVSLQLFLP